MKHIIRDKKIIIISVILIVVLILGALFISIHNYKVQNQVQSFSVQEYKQEITDFSSNKIFGYVRKLGEIISAETAKEYAQKIWLEIYGEHIKKCRPYKVYWDEENDNWLVEGTLRKNVLGGVPYIIFSKNDGEIVAVWHER